MKVCFPFPQSPILLSTIKSGPANTLENSQICQTTSSELLPRRLQSLLSGLLLPLSLPCPFSQSQSQTSVPTSGLLATLVSCSPWTTCPPSFPAFGLPCSLLLFPSWLPSFACTMHRAWLPAALKTLLEQIHEHKITVSLWTPLVVTHSPTSYGLHGHCVLMVITCGRCLSSMVPSQSHPLPSYQRKPCYRGPFWLGDHR